jgi:hypothetical protein
MQINEVRLKTTLLGARDPLLVAQAKSTWKLTSEEDFIAKPEILVLASQSSNWKWKDPPSSCPNERPNHDGFPTISLKYQIEHDCIGECHVKGLSGVRSTTQIL